jgi:hypothetical protein
MSGSIIPYEMWDDVIFTHEKSYSTTISHNILIAGIVLEKQCLQKGLRQVIVV